MNRVCVYALAVATIALLGTAACGGGSGHDVHLVVNVAGNRMAPEKVSAHLDDKVTLKLAAEKVGAKGVESPRRGRAFLRGLPRVRGLRVLGGTLGVVFLLAIMATGWFGSSKPDGNPAEYLTWIYFWAGLVVLTGLLGPIWDWVNPFRALDSLIRRIRGAADPPAGEADRLAGVGIWPAAFLFFCFACLELTSGYANRP